MRRACGRHDEGGADLERQGRVEALGVAFARSRSQARRSCGQVSGRSAWAAGEGRSAGPVQGLRPRTPWNFRASQTWDWARVVLRQRRVIERQGGCENVRVQVGSV